MHKISTILQSYFSGRRRNMVGGLYNKMHNLYDI